MRIISLLALLIIYKNAGAQAVRTPALAPVYQFTACLDTPGVFSFLVNPAALPHIRNFSVGIASERRYLLQELGHHSFAASLPLQNSAFGFAAALFGDLHLQERLLRLAYGRTMGKGVSLGLAFHHFSRRIPGYASQNVLTWEVGARLQCTPSFHLGLQVFHPALEQREVADFIPSSFSIGAGYRISQPVYIGLHVEKMNGQAASIEAGIRYMVHHRVQASLGLSTSTGSYFLSVAIRFASWDLQVSAALHPYLGITPGMGLHYQKAQP